LGKGKGKGDAALATLAARFEADFRAALDDDLNAPRACARCSSSCTRGTRRWTPKRTAPRWAPASRSGEAVLDVLPTARTVDAELEGWIQDRIAARDKARKSKDFKEADRIRAELTRRAGDRGHALRTKWRLV